MRRQHEAQEQRRFLRRRLSEGHVQRQHSTNLLEQKRIIGMRENVASERVSFTSARETDGAVMKFATMVEFEERTRYNSGDGVGRLPIMRPDAAPSGVWFPVHIP